ncbi:SusD family protein [compost metagenome]
MIANSNVILDKSKSVIAISTDSIERRQIIGEAYALRALAYHDLVRLYAQPYNFTADASHWGVPLFTKAVYEKGSVANLGRSSVKEVYVQIAKDLDSAINNLPERLRAKGANLDAKYKGRLNLFGAKALKARVALYMGDYATAVSLATEVINKKSLYTLLLNDKYVSDFKLNNNTETIFEVVNTNIDNMGTNSLVHFYNQSGYGDALASDDLYNAYAKTDVRRSFMQKGTRKDGETNASLVIKYTSTSTRDESMKVMRLAEMYLIRAEANIKLGNDALALADISVIAKRGDKDAVDIVVPLEGLMGTLLAERRKEFPFEGHRLFDLNRNGFNFTKFRTGGETINVTYPNQRVILPIPQSELDANPSIRSQQNPGYGGL